MLGELGICIPENEMYPICLEDSFQNIISLVSRLNLKDRKICLVSDSNVAPLYAKEVSDILKKEGCFCVQFTFPAGEASKNLDTAAGLYEFLIENSFDRKDILFALGGGVTGDLTGFVAATYLRGIRFVGIPTSLLSMVDSSIGGKTGVDYKAYKNMVGAFYQPSAVYINLSVLQTLPEREFLAGMGEVVKHGFILPVQEHTPDESEKDAIGNQMLYTAYFEFLQHNKEKILAKNQEELLRMIIDSLTIKKRVVQNDPKENGQRALLNFGHTIGHAIEKLSNFSLLHGECVSIGMVAAINLSVMRGYLSQKEAREMKELLQAFGMKTTVSSFERKELLSVCHSDKKADGKKIKFVLLKGIGQAFLDDEVTDDDIWNAFLSVTE